MLLLRLFNLCSFFVIVIMAASSPDTFEKGDPVLYRDRLCTVDNIQLTYLGYRCYTVVDVESGDFFHVPKHALQKPDVQDIAFCDIDWDEAIELPVVLQSVPSVPAVLPDVEAKATNVRHAVLEESKIDEIASSHLSALV